MSDEANDFDAPLFESGEYFIEVRDTAQPGIAYQQGDSLFDKAHRFVAKARNTVKAPPKPKTEVKTRDISQRTVGKAREVLKQVAGKVSEVRTQRTKRAVEQVEGPGVRRLNALAGLTDVINNAARENARAAAAESQAG